MLEVETFSPRVCTGTQGVVLGPGQSVSHPEVPSLPPLGATCRKSLNNEGNKITLEWLEKMQLLHAAFQQLPYSLFLLLSILALTLFTITPLERRQ